MNAKVTVPSLLEKKSAGEKIVALTAYDYPSALLADHAGMDCVLVGDTLASTALGYESTLPVRMEEMLVAFHAVRRGIERALLIADMPFGSYQVDISDAVRNAVEFVKAGAEAIKLEGGRHREKVIHHLVENDIPVIGHIGLTPQSLHALGGYRVQGKKAGDASRIVEDALRLEDVGISALVLEAIPSNLATTITARLTIPTIGIGAGAHCDGQILVFADLLGLLPGKTPKFVRRYAELYQQALQAINAYGDDVRAGSFPSEEESYLAPSRATARALR